MGFILSLLGNKNVLIAGAIIALAGGIYGNYTYQKHKIDKLESAAAELENRLKIREAQVSGLEQSMKSMVSTLNTSIELTEEVSKKQDSIAQDVDAKLKVFEGDRLERLTIAKPGLIEIRANKATEAAFKQIEDETVEFRESNQ